MLKGLPERSWPTTYCSLLNLLNQQLLHRPRPRRHLNPRSHATGTASKVMEFQFQATQIDTPAIIYNPGPTTALKRETKPHKKLFTRTYRISPSSSGVVVVVGVVIVSLEMESPLRHPHLLLEHPRRQPSICMQLMQNARLF